MNDWLPSDDPHVLHCRLISGSHRWCWSGNHSRDWWCTSCSLDLLADGPCRTFSDGERRECGRGDSDSWLAFYSAYQLWEQEVQQWPFEEPVEECWQPRLCLWLVYTAPPVQPSLFWPLLVRRLNLTRLWVLLCFISAAAQVFGCQTVSAPVHRSLCSGVITGGSWWVVWVAAGAGAKEESVSWQG